MQKIKIPAETHMQTWELGALLGPTIAMEPVHPFLSLHSPMSEIPLLFPVCDPIS